MTPSRTFRKVDARTALLGPMAALLASLALVGTLGVSGCAGDPAPTGGDTDTSVSPQPDAGGDVDGAQQDVFDPDAGPLPSLTVALLADKTTGNAPFCGAGDTPCVPCKRDTDCVALGFGVGAACVVCNFLCAAESGGTMCIAAGV